MDFFQLLQTSYTEVEEKEKTAESEDIENKEGRGEEEKGGKEDKKR
jgi:hypothetical protein